MEKKIIATIILLVLLLFSVWAILKHGENQVNQEESKLLIRENPTVCYMPRDCFETEKEYLNQFPGKEEPRYFPECLIYCYE